MDKPELNPLIRGVKWDAQDIDQAMQRVVDYFNETAPFSIVLNTRYFPYRYTLLIGVAGHLLRSASISDAVNQLDYSADGVSIQDRNKADIFMRIGNMFWEEFKEKVLMIKVEQNMNNCFGSSPSELQYMAR